MGNFNSWMGHRNLICTAHVTISPYSRNILSHKIDDIFQEIMFSVLFVWLKMDYAKTTKWISMKLGGSRKNPVNFGLVLE